MGRGLITYPTLTTMKAETYKGYTITTNSSYDTPYYSCTALGILNERSLKRVRRLIDKKLAK